MSEIAFAAELAAWRDDDCFEPHGFDASASAAISIGKQWQQVQDVSVLLQQRAVAGWAEIGATRNGERSIAATAFEGSVSMMEAVASGMASQRVARVLIDAAEAQYALFGSYLAMLLTLCGRENPDLAGTGQTQG